MHGHGLDVHGGEELLALRERLPVRMCSADLLQSCSRHAEQRVIDAHESLAHHPQQRGVLEELVRLVDRTRL